MGLVQPKSKKGPAWTNDVEAPPIAEQHPPAAQEPEAEALSDAEWLRRRTTAGVDVDAKVFEQDEEKSDVR